MPLAFDFLRLRTSHPIITKKQLLSLKCFFPPNLVPRCKLISYLRRKSSNPNFSLHCIPTAHRRRAPCHKMIKLWLPLLFRTSISLTKYYRKHYATPTIENKEQHHVSNSSFNGLRSTIKVLCTCSKPDPDTPEKTPKLLKRLEQSRPLFTTVPPKGGKMAPSGSENYSSPTTHTQSRQRICTSGAWTWQCKIITGINSFETLKKHVFLGLALTLWI